MFEQHHSSTADTRLLVITGSAKDAALIRETISTRHWSMTHAGSLHEGLQLLEQEDVAIIVCDHSLPDGEWTTLLAEADTRPTPPLVIVLSSLADDRLWSEVLNLGGFDVLMKPLEKSEIIYVLNLAWSCWRERSVAALARALTPAAGCPVHP